MSENRQQLCFSAALAVRVRGIVLPRGEGSDSHLTEKQTNTISRPPVAEQAATSHTQTVAASLLQGSNGNGNRGLGMFLYVPSFKGSEREQNS